MSQQKTVDPLTLSLIEGRLDSLNEELGKRLCRQAFSFATAQIRDLGTALLDKKERMLNIGNFLPCHSAGSDICLKAMLDWIGRENIHPDDFIIGNDPFIVQFGHAPDWSFVRPVFYEGELVFYHYMRTHQFDSGGAFMACYFPRTYDCHGEGLMIPPVKIIEEGKIDEKVYSIILRNVRGPAMVRADNMLIYASMKRAEERIIDMLRSYGKDTVMAACDELIRRTEEMVRKTISTWPVGVYQSEAAADWDGTTDRPVWVRLSLTVKPEEGQLIFDFSDSDPMCDFINVPLGQQWASVVVGVAWSLPAGTPRNQGLVNCITIKTKEGTVLSPVYPATTGAQTVILGIQVTECVQLALSQVVPKDTCAVWGGPLNPIFAGKRRDRIDPRTKSPQVYWVGGFHSHASMGAIYGYDATEALGACGVAGAAVRAPVEVCEWDTPYRWLRYEFWTDSAGAGQWRGGLGTHVEIMNTYDPKVWQPLDCVVMTGNSDGEKFGSPGTMGGKEGKKHKLGIIRKGKQEPLRTIDVQYIRPGDIIIAKSGGGGGVGDPLDREVEKVRWDALNKVVSIESAKSDYGVVIDPETFEVDYEATKKLREKLKAREKV